MNHPLFNIFLLIGRVFARAFLNILSAALSAGHSVACALQLLKNMMRQRETGEGLTQTRRLLDKNVAQGGCSLCVILCVKGLLNPCLCWPGGCKGRALFSSSHCAE